MGEGVMAKIEKRRPMLRALDKATETRDILRGVREDLDALFEYVTGPQVEPGVPSKQDVPVPTVGAFDELMVALNANADQALAIRQVLAELAQKL